MENATSELVLPGNAFLNKGNKGLIDNKPVVFSF